jgi:membrane-anchored protein YejM (alkaline phosphatase superfamily)
MAPNTPFLPALFDSNQTGKDPIVLGVTVMPYISHIAEKTIFYKENCSGGNANHFGLFTFFYGLNTPNWFTFFSAPKDLVLFDVLKRLGYQIGINYSTDTKWPEFRQIIFYQVKERIDNRIPGNPWEKDVNPTPKRDHWHEKIDLKNLDTEAYII